MKKLEKLVQQLNQLAQEQRWQEMIDIDDEVRQTIAEATGNMTAADRIESKACLLRIQEIYAAAVGQLEGNRGESQQQMRQIQRGFRAAKSYLDHSKS